MRTFSTHRCLWHLHLILLLFLGSSSYAGTRVYRCQDAAGRTEFRQTPCPGAEGVPLSLDAPRIGWIKPESSRTQRERVRPPAAVTASAVPQRPSPAQQRRCWKREQRLQQLQRKLRQGYKPSQGERLRRQRDEQEAYLRRFCED
jgi:hypothetical protein